MANDLILKKKQELVDALVVRLKEAKTVIAFDYHGLSVLKFEKLRRKARQQGCEIEVIKNNISQRAAGLLGIEQFAHDLLGPKALIFGKDVIAPAKSIYEFAKENTVVQIRSGIVEGKYAPSSKLEELATMPNYETLLTMLAFGMLGTVRNLAVGLNMLCEQKAN